MRVIAWVSLFFGFIGLLLLDGQTFSHAVTGIVCGIIAIGSGLACARRDHKSGGRRWGGLGTAVLGFGLAVFCIIQLPSAYRHQEKFNAISRMAQERQKSSQSPDSRTNKTFLAALQNTNNGLLHVIASDFRSPKIERELKYYVANFSTNATNHFYVGATELDNGKLVTALVYWKEPRILMNYGELTDDTPEGAEIFAWQGHHLKLGRDTVDTPEDIAGSTYLETHHQWVDWMEQCISKGKLYVVTVNEATNAFPNADRTKADNE